MYIFLEPSCELKKSIRSIFIILKNISVFDLLFIIGMVSYKVLVLVKVGNTKIFFLFLPEAIRVGGFLVTFQGRYFLLDTVIVLKQKSTEALAVQGGLLSEVFTIRGLKRYFSRRSTKQRRQVHPGDTFQPQGLTPAPMTRWTSSIFSPRRFCLSVWTLFQPRKKAKAFETKTCTGNLVTVLVSLFIIAQLPECFVLCVCVLMSMYNLYYYYFCT